MLWNFSPTLIRFSTLEKFVQTLMYQYRAVLSSKSPKTRHKIWAFFPSEKWAIRNHVAAVTTYKLDNFPADMVWEVPIKYHMSASLGSCRSAVFWYRRPLVIFLKGHKIAKYPRKSSFCFFFPDRKMNATQMLLEFWTKEKKRRGREWMTFWIWRRAFTIEINSGWQSIFLDTFQRCMMKTVFGVYQL